jgi:predicted ABC-type ATPase
MTANPSVIVLAGPNGAGKTTAAPALLRELLGVIEFVNSDTIAQGLAAFGPERVALEAAGIMLTRLHELASLRRSFAFETTLASRSLAPWLADLTRTSYQFQLVFLWLPGEEVAVARVTDRARMGGHDVPAQTVRRRYHAGLRNFFRLYRPLAATWAMYDNSEMGSMRLIASGETNIVRQIGDEAIWRRVQEEYCHDEKD